MICSTVRIFLRHCQMLILLSTCPAPLQYNGAGQVDISITQFSHKISFSGKRTIKTQFGPKLFNFISHDLLQRFFLKHFSMMGDRQTKADKGNIGQFPQKSFFSAIGQFGHKLGQNYATLWHKQLYLMICSLRILKCCSMMGFNIQTKVMSVSLPKKFPSRQE